jgi:hypothetical protein
MKGNKGLSWPRWRSNVDDYHVPHAICANCGERIDGASPVDGGRAPQPGDVSLCLYCHHLMIFGDDSKPRNPTDEEMMELAGDPDLIRAMKTLAEFKRGTRCTDSY